MLKLLSSIFKQISKKNCNFFIVFLSCLKIVYPE